MHQKANINARASAAKSASPERPAAVPARQPAARPSPLWQQLATTPPLPRLQTKLSVRVPNVQRQPAGGEPEPSLTPDKEVRSLTANELEVVNSAETARGEIMTAAIDRLFPLVDLLRANDARLRPMSAETAEALTLVRRYLRVRPSGWIAADSLEFDWLNVPENALFLNQAMRALELMILARGLLLPKFHFLPPHCEERRGLFARTKRKIDLCPKFFGKGPYPGKVCREWVLIHEYFHPLGVYHGESAEDTSRMQRPGPQQAIQNANALASLAFELGGRDLAACGGLSAAEIHKEADDSWVSQLQPKLTVGAPNDPYEKEADQVAAQVMRMPEPAVQRKCAACEEEEKEGTVQAREEPGEVPALTPTAESRIRGLRGGGSPLPEPARSYFEPRFGRDFSGVRVHTGPAAAESAREIRARAFTVGHDIAFASGQYAPDTQAGGLLLAHELTHVVQQGGGGAAAIQREPAESEKEKEARSFVEGVMWLMSTGIREYRSGDHIQHPERHPNTLRQDLDTIRSWFLNARNRVTKELNDDPDLQKKLIEIYRLYVYTAIEGFERKLKQLSWKLYQEHKDVIDPLAGPPPAGKAETVQPDEKGKDMTVQLDKMDTAVLPKLREARCGMVNKELEHCGNVLQKLDKTYRVTGPTRGGKKLEESGKERDICEDKTIRQPDENHVAYYHSHPRDRSKIPPNTDPNLDFTLDDKAEADKLKIIFYLVNWENEVLKYHPSTRDTPGWTETITKFENLDCNKI